MVNRPYRHADGFYHIKGMKFPNLFGSRKMVYTYGTAYKTRGNLTKADLIKNKNGDVVSKKKHFSAKKDNRLVKKGYGTQKGKFGWVKIAPGRGRRTRRMRGGAGGAEGAIGGPSPAGDALVNNFKSSPASV